VVVEARPYLEFRRQSRLPGAFRLLSVPRERFSTIRLVWADDGYAGRLVTWAATVIRLTVTIVTRSDDDTGFAVLPRRWVVERT
jgi:transposase